MSNQYTMKPETERIRNLWSMAKIDYLQMKIYYNSSTMNHNGDA